MLRMRPYTSQELIKNNEPGWLVDKDVDKISSWDPTLHNHPFTFDRIFTE